MGRLAERIRPLTEKQKSTTQANMGLVYKVVNQGKFVHLPREDQDQEGSIALAKAVRKHRKNGGANLATYATRAIKNRILMAEQQDHLIHIPVYLFSDKFADNPLQDDVQKASRFEPIDSIWHDDPNHPAVPKDDEPEFGWKAMRAVRWAVQKLPPKERDVIRGLMFRGQTPGQLGTKYGIHVSKIHIIRDSALAKLRTSLVKHV